MIPIDGAFSCLSVWWHGKHAHSGAHGAHINIKIVLCMRNREYWTLDAEFSIRFRIDTVKQHHTLWFIEYLFCGYCLRWNCMIDAMRQYWCDSSVNSAPTEWRDDFSGSTECRPNSASTTNRHIAATMSHRLNAHVPISQQIASTNRHFAATLYWSCISFSILTLPIFPHWFNCMQIRNF